MDRPLRLGALTIDLASGEAEPGPPITGKELAVLRHLAERPGRVVPRDALLHAVWGAPPSARTRMVDTTISRLRRRIEPRPADPAWLKTVHGQGYVLVAAPSTAVAPPLDRGLFVGRTSELDFLTRWAAALESPWLTVVGPPGIGKSRLVRELHGRTTSTLVHLSAARDALDIVATLCQALGLRIDAFGDAPTWLARTLDRREVLLLLDDLDGVHGPAEALRGALAHCPGVRVIATTRRALGFPGERLLRLGPIKDAAARALATTLGAPGLPLDDAAGNPLAITVHAAAHRAGAPAERGLDGVLRSSWSRLAPSDRQLLARLSLFVGRFDEEAAIEAFSARAHALDRLVEEGLVEAWGTRLGLHPAVRAFARRALEHTDDGPWARARHTAYHLDDLAARLGALRSAGPLESLDILSSRLDDLDAAWTSAVAEGDLPRLGRALPAAEELVSRAGLWIHGERWFGRAAAAAAASPAERLDFLAAQAVSTSALGRGTAAWDALGEVLAGAPELPLATRARALVARGRAGSAVKADREVVACFEQAIVAARASGDARLCLLTLLSWLNFHTGAGVQLPSEAEVDEAVAAARALGEPRLRAEASYNRGIWLFRQGRYADAWAALTDARRVLHGHGEGRPLTTILAWEAVVCSQLGHHAEADALFAQVEALYERQGVALQLWSLRRNRGVMLVHRELFTRAGPLFAEVRDAARRLVFPRLEMSATEDLANLSVSICAWREAIAYGEEARRLRREHGVERSANDRIYLALARLMSGDTAGALDEVEAGLRPDTGLRDPRWDEAQVLAVLACAARGEVPPEGDYRVPAGMIAWATARALLLRDPVAAGRAARSAPDAEAPYRALLSALVEQLGPDVSTDTSVTWKPDRAPE